MNKVKVPPPSKKVVYSQAVEGLVRCLGVDLTPSLQDRMMELGVNVRGSLNVEYPADVWCRCLVAVTETLHPTLSRDARMQKLGERFITRGYPQTLAGKATVGLLQVIGPTAFIKRFKIMVGSSNNYLRAETSAVTDTSCEVWLNQIYELQGFGLGVLQQSIYMAGAKEVTGSFKYRKEDECVILFAWRA